MAQECANVFINECAGRIVDTNIPTVIIAISVRIETGQRELIASGLLLLLGRAAMEASIG